jgi:hypothetical protein
MPVLVIGAAERKQIKKLIEEALKHPVSLSRVMDAGHGDNRDVLTLEERQPGFERPASSHIVFPGGYRVAFSFEEQPIGLCSHMSISVMGRKRKGMMPSPEAVEMICEEFGVPFPPLRGWTEEFEPGEYAINLVSKWKTNDPL